MSASYSQTLQNFTELEKQELEIIHELHHLLNGYKSILIRYDEESLQGKQIIGQNYRFQPNQFGRPDRLRGKLTSDEAVTKLHNIEDVFPYYKTNYNVSEITNDTNVREAIEERISEVHETLQTLEDKFQSSGAKIECTNAVKVAVLIFLVFKFV